MSGEVYITNLCFNTFIMETKYTIISFLFKEFNVQFMVKYMW